MKRKLIYIALCAAAGAGSFASTGSVQAQAPLVVEEYRLGAEQGKGHGNGPVLTEQFSAYRAKRAKWRGLKLPAPPFTGIDEKVKPLGYRLARGRQFASNWGEMNTYDLFQGEKQVVSSMAELTCFSVDALSGKFAMVAQKQETAGPRRKDVLIYDGKVEEWIGHDHAYQCPIVVAGGGLFTINLKKGERERPGVLAHFTVDSDKGTEYAFVGDTYKDNTVSAFFAQGKDWVLAYDDHVVVSGVDIGARQGYAKVFFFHDLGERPFYFFEKYHKTYVSFDGKTLPYEYDYVLHDQCCEAGMHNVYGNDTMIMFFGLKNGYWYYVEMGTYRE